MAAPTETRSPELGDPERILERSDPHALRRRILDAGFSHEPIESEDACALVAWLESAVDARAYLQAVDVTLDKVGAPPEDHGDGHPLTRIERIEALAAAIAPEPEASPIALIRAGLAMAHDDGGPSACLKALAGALEGHNVNTAAKEAGGQ